MGEEFEVTTQEMRKVPAEMLQRMEDEEAVEAMVAAVTVMGR